MFYDRFYELCLQKGVKPGRACTEMGVSRGLAAKWKATSAGKPSADVLEKMSVYFGKSINEILGTPETEKAPTPESERETDLSPAFFRLKQGLEPYDLSESDADFLLEVYKAHIKKNQ